MNMVFSALKDWNPWWETKELLKDLTGIPRFDSKKIIKFINEREIKIITGVRRAGKSTVLYQIIDHLLNAGIKSENILLVNFEDKKFKNKDIDDIFNVYQRELGPEGKTYVFLDEIQKVKDWAPWIRKKYDLFKNISFVISGSSAHLLEKEYSTLLTGRNIKFQLTPLDFKEFLYFKNFKVKNPKLTTTQTRNRLLHLLYEYLEYGGLPEIVLKKKILKKPQLNHYFDDIINKDVVARYDLSSIKAFDLARYLLTNTGNLFSFRSARAFTKLGMETLEKYLSKIIETCLIYLVPIFSYSIKDQTQYARKIYCVDSGLRNTVAFKFSEDIGRIAENIVFIELKRRYVGPRYEIYYWKNQKHREVDFLIKDELKVKQLIQVCWNIENPDTKKRELKGLLEAMEEFKLRSGLILTEDIEKEEAVDGKKITYVPLWRWLLEK